MQGSQSAASQNNFSIYEEKNIGRIKICNSKSTGICPYFFTKHKHNFTSNEIREIIYCHSAVVY